MKLASNLTILYLVDDVVCLGKVDKRRNLNVNRAQNKIILSLYMYSMHICFFFQCTFSSTCDYCAVSLLDVGFR